MTTIICHCFNVTDDDVVNAVKAGATSVEEVQELTNAGYGCGSCREDITRLVLENL